LEAGGGDEGGDEAGGVAALGHEPDGGERQRGAGQGDEVNPNQYKARGNQGKP